jgi:cation diffusion facilitator CzcD-associated flavoprotein CzcO
MTDHLRVAIIGAGFAGLGMAIKLEEAGVGPFAVFERASELGGTWRENHYPGCCCDVPSHVYSYSFALNKGWTRGFAPQWEILQYLNATADAYGVREHVRFDHEVREAAWDEDARRWTIDTAQGRFTADVLVNAGGALSEPKDPDIPGIETFAGTKFHSARWDHDHDLRGERVGVIGTGASAIQFVPAIQPDVAQLLLFQRTAPWVIPRFDHEITRAEHLLLRLPYAEAIVRAVLYWLLETRVWGFRHPRLMKVADRVARWHLRRQVSDPELQEKLTPGYIMGCKRILISDDYYPALDRDNVGVVTEGIAEVREHAIVTKDGTEHPVDTIVFGTGFEVTKPPIARRIRGRDGRTLAEHWATSMQAYRGTTVAGLSELRDDDRPEHRSGAQLDDRDDRVAAGVRPRLPAGARRAGREGLRGSPDAVARYNAELERQMQGTVWTAGQCQSWYLDDTGRNTTLWPGFSWDFRRRLRRFDPEAYELERAA